MRTFVIPLLLVPFLPSLVFADDLDGRVQQQMESLKKQAQITGAVTLVMESGKLIHHQAHGHRDVAGKIPMSKDTVFAIASMTKPITATGLMILVDDGKVKLSDPVSKWIPEFASVATTKKEPATRPITVQDALTHTSGLVGSQRVKGSLAETAKMLAKRPLGFQPGERWQYSPGLNICGRIIEIASGMSYQQFLQLRILDPLKMKDTTFRPNEAQRKRLAQLHRPTKDKKGFLMGAHRLLDFDQPLPPNPSGGLFSTARDMSRFYQAILNGGTLGGTRIVSAKAVSQMTQVKTGQLKTGFTPGNGWGLGWCIVRHPQGVTAMLSPGTYGHGGAFGTQGWVDPKRKMIFVLMIQRTGYGNGDASVVRQAFQEAATAVPNR